MRLRQKTVKCIPQNSHFLPSDSKHHLNPGGQPDIISVVLLLDSWTYLSSVINICSFIFWCTYLQLYLARSFPKEKHWFSTQRIIVLQEHTQHDIYIVKHRCFSYSANPDQLDRINQWPHQNFLGLSMKFSGFIYDLWLPAPFWSMLRTTYFQLLSHRQWGTPDFS